MPTRCDNRRICLRGADFRGARIGLNDTRQRGVTLIELLVVVAVLVLLLGIAVPRMKPVLDRGRIREAARQVNAYMSAAQARATQLGRPAGVWLERLPDGACVDLSPAEVPPVYSGDFLGAMVRCVLEGSPGSQRWRVEFNDFSVTLKHLVATAQVNRLRFFMRFDYRGGLYPVELINPDDLSTPPVMVIVDNPGNASRLDPPVSAQGQLVPFQLYQLPRKASGRSLQLTGGAIVDLNHSGFGNYGTQFQSAGSMVILFSPGGGVDSVAVLSTGETIQPTAPLHLLIGRLDRIEVTGTLDNASGGTTQYDQNLTNPESVWISIGHRTGLISSSENAWELQPANDPLFERSLATAREFAQTSQTLGGR